MQKKRILIFAGPNGSGKTTFAQAFLPYEAQCPNFVNADMIAAGLSPFQPEKVTHQAGRILIARMKEHVKKEECFAVETTLSGRVYARLIPKWRSEGYSVKLFFLRLPSPEFAIKRVRQRVVEGGHNVADNVITRRFHAGISNLEVIYKPLVDDWALYDSAGELPCLVDEKANHV